MTPSNNTVIQQAWVVKDLDSAIRQWSDAFNIGPFYVAEYTPAVFSTLEYRGAPGTLHMNTAITYSGDVQIELVEPVGSYPCAFFDSVAEGTNGYHHMCYWSDDIDADLAHYVAQGFTIANQGQIVGGGPRFAYIDANETLGCMIELLERRESTVELFNSWKENCKTWTPDQDLIIKL